MIIGIFCHTRKTSVLTSEKRCTSCPKWGEGGGEVIRAMPKRKHSFLKEVFPYEGQDDPKTLNSHINLVRFPNPLASQSQAGTLSTLITHLLVG